jgi:hypothetical protein
MNARSYGIGANDHDVFLTASEPKMKKTILALVWLAAFAQPAFSAETITVTHGQVAAPTLLDFGPVGVSAGDQRIWHFSGTAPGNVTVIIDFIMTTTAQSADTTQVDSRMTDAVFSFGQGTGDKRPKTNAQLSTVNFVELIMRIVMQGQLAFVLADFLLFAGSTQHSQNSKLTRDFQN